MQNMARYPRHQSEARGFFTCALGAVVVVFPILLIIAKLIEWAMMRFVP